MTKKTAVARAKALQQRTPLPALAVLRRMRISQADVSYVAERSQGYVSSILNSRRPLDPAVADAILLLVGNSATRDELFGEATS
jgi:hypothetical protein